MCFRALAFSEANLSPLFSSSGIVGSLLNLVAFLVIEILSLDLFRVSTPALDIALFVPQVMVERYCCCFECRFYISQASSSIFSWDVQPFHICFKM